VTDNGANIIKAIRALQEEDVSSNQPDNSDIVLQEVIDSSDDEYAQEQVTGDTVQPDSAMDLGRQHEEADKTENELTNTFRQHGKKRGKCFRYCYSK
jgi:hypothetical protein